MTQKIKSIAATMFLCFGIASFSFAQNAYANNEIKVNQTTNPVSATAAENIPMENVVISPEMEAKFINLFPHATAQKWTAAVETYFVSFTNNGSKATASFNTNGKINYVITTCTMDQLPADFSKAIKTNYAGYQLFNAKEIKAYGATAYQAILENATGYITLKYTIDGVEEIQQVKK